MPVSHHLVGEKIVTRQVGNICNNSSFNEYFFGLSRDAVKSWIFCLSPKLPVKSFYDALVIIEAQWLVVFQQQRTVDIHEIT